MYFPVGWPKVLRLPSLADGVEAAEDGEGATADFDPDIRQVVCNRDRILAAIVTSNALQIWYVKPCVPIVCHRRQTDSVEEIGVNFLAHWKPDSSMICVATTKGHLIIYHIVVPTDVKTLYELVDLPKSGFKRESDELFVKELIPPLIFSLAFEVEVEGGISDLVAIREELMIATYSGRILRYSWDGQEIRDYSLDLRRIPFCMDQQVLKAVPLADRGAYVAKISYSPLLSGYAIVLNDGRAAFLVASNANFDPNSVTGVWAGQLDDATCIALNHKYKLMAFGRKNSQGAVYSIDDLTGGLLLSHRLILKSRDFPGSPGAVSCLRWTPDGTALAMTWALGGFSIWSTFGAMIMCSLCWDYGMKVSDPVTQNPLCLTSVDWSAEGYQLWMVNAKERAQKEVDPEFMPYPEEHPGERRDAAAEENDLANKVLVLQFAKSPISVNPGMSKQEQIFLQAEDRLYLNLGQTREFSSNQEPSLGGLAGPVAKGNISLSLMTSGSKNWMTISIPHTYMGSSWPTRYTAMDNSCQYLAVAGRTGLAHYSIPLRKWRLFGNETQEKDFIVTGGLLWWKDFIVAGCYSLASLVDEVRFYPRTEKLDNAYAKIFRVDAQVVLLNLLNDQLVVFCADNILSIYNLSVDEDAKASSLACVKTRTFDANSIPGLSFHPACVSLVSLTHLRTETLLKSGNRESLSRDSPPPPQSPTGLASSAEPSIILNVCGRVIMIQSQDPRQDKGDSGRESPPLALPTVLASCCETIWFPRHTNPDKPHLTASLWLYCGAHGMRVWLPVFPRDGEHTHTFMSKRIMLHFPLQKLYPLAILFEDAILLGVENDTVLLRATGFKSSNVPYSVLDRSSLLFLHPILRQLIRRNLGYHAWEIGRTCMTLPYFQHCLELLLHEVLEEEATSNEPIPDALLPSIVEFIQEFPVFHRTIGRCARKTEVALWPHLFAVVGSPRALFMECLTNRDLETASSYLLILQNLEPPAIAQNHATLLLDAALDSGSWDLAKELIRFLRTIDPDELGEGSQRHIPPTHYSKTPQTPPINTSAPEEEISLLLGTLQVPRGRAPSIATPMAKSSPKEPVNHKELGRSFSAFTAIKANHPLVSPTLSGPNATPPATGTTRSRKVSSSSFKETSPNTSSASETTVEHFFIDVILHRHARKLLAECRLFDLGTFAAHLDFHMVTWMKKESLRAAKVENSVAALKKVHSDFAWPFPILLMDVVNELRRKYSQESSTGGEAPAAAALVPNGIGDHSSLSDKFRALRLDIQETRVTTVPAANVTVISDSGYSGSHANNDDDHNASHLSEQTINAMLKPQVIREDVSVVSDDCSSMAGIDEYSSVNSSDWAATYNSLPTKEDAVSKGPQKSEVQLRYLLQIMVEANCLELATIISIVLKDALALVRIVNAARTSTDSKSCATRLIQNLRAMEAWAQVDCPGYVPFFRAIQPQMCTLQSFLGVTSAT